MAAVTPVAPWMLASEYALERTDIFFDICLQMMVERDLDIPSSVADSKRELQIYGHDNATDPLIAYIDAYASSQLFHGQRSISTS
jgi:hypothetical protein